MYGDFETYKVLSKKYLTFYPISPCLSFMYSWLVIDLILKELLGTAF